MLVIMLAPTGPHDLHAPISRTARYKKITKPLLERQRRARINRCLDELKELMVGALQNINKLEKADILELTVRHLHRLHQQGLAGGAPDLPAGAQPAPVQDPVHRFQAGFSHCASEACHFLLGLPGLDPRISRRLVAHLGQCADSLQAPLRISVPSSSSSSASAFSPPVSPPPARHMPPPLPPPGTEYVLSSTPSALDLARPMEGLLMTVSPGPSSAPDRATSPGRNPAMPVNASTDPVWRPWSH
ncbi:hypothetical protein B566_EDAN013391 [Ephemera danica]|nr:hypothetical protein B566_EDAN013391 [Ephemera danica]